MAVGVALGHGACSSRSKTVVTGVQDAAGGTGGSGAGGSGAGGSSGSAGEAGDATGGSGGAAVGYANMVLSDGPSLYWRELAGTASLVDVSPEHNDGTYVGCVQPAAIGAGPTIHFCGGYLQAGDIFDFADTAPFTFEAWIKPESVQLSEFARIVGKENPVAGPRQGWDLILISWGQDAGTPSLVFERWDSVDGSGVTVANPTILSDRFSHVAITYDGAACRIYLNGVSALEDASTLSIADTSGTFRIAADPFGGSNWLGDMAEIAVYEKVLLPERVAAHYDEGKTEGF